LAVCRYHPDRPGIGVCMRCRAVICAACSTRVDGVNHCHACLKQLGRRVEPRRSGPGAAAAGAVCVLGIAWLFFFGLLWLVQGGLAP
jgi:hypothetical protein